MQKLNVLVVGSGGREHALVWKIFKSKLVGKIFCAPGNAGISEIAQCIAIDAENTDGLLEFVLREKIDLTIVGPEGPLVKGIVDKFQLHGLKIFGPTASAALIESSKAFAKQLMQGRGVPTSGFHVLADIDEALELVQGMDKAVVKADGLAAGKGVFVCHSRQEIFGAVNRLLREKIFDKASERIIIEELLEGPEVSVLAFCDGKNFSLMPAAQDHKRVFDNDLGPNTGGMGAICPVHLISPELKTQIVQKIFAPVLAELNKRKTPFVGVLYAGLMLTSHGPKVLEFNCRFGDPETQAILPLLETDLVQIMLACIDGKLSLQKIAWNDMHAACLIMASCGYPEKFEKGKQIFGLEKTVKQKNVLIFHSGTKKENQKILTDGGRVLGVTGIGNTAKESIENAYKTVSLISFENMHFRKDIGKKSIDL